MGRQLVGLDRPVILLGRGGSGTRMLTELALGLGVFLGGSLNDSGDSLEWVASLYDLAIDASHGQIEAGSARDLDWRARLRALASGILADAGRDPEAAWGWKLPETMLTLGVALRAFPDARVVHLVRHPLTSSLRRTHLTSRLDNPIGQIVLEAAYRAAGLDLARLSRDGPYVHNAASWNYQVRSALSTLTGTDARVLQVRYEELCASPARTQALIAAFIGADIPDGAPSCSVDAARTNAIDPSDQRADVVWSICGETAQSLGYRRMP